MTEKKIIVKFYFDNSDSPDTVDARLLRARIILSEHGGVITEEKAHTKNGVNINSFRATIPNSQYDKHHGFDSKLNAEWPKGCGAGYVGDDDST